MRTVALARFFLVAGLVSACGSTPGLTPGASTPASAPPVATATMPAATNNPSPGVATAIPYPVPAMTPIEPAAIIEVPGAIDIIWLTTDGETIWASTTDAILRIDAATNAVTSLPAPSISGDATLAIAEDGLWMTRWAGNRVFRLDPKTGAVELTAVVDKAVKLTFIGDDLWVGREDALQMFLFDRTTGELGRSLPVGPRAISGLGDLWFSSSQGIKRVDPASGEVKATIAFQDEGNCGVSGVFPDNAWITCFGREVVPRRATRLDTVTNTVATVAALPAVHGGSVTIIDGKAWFVGAFEDAERKPYGGLLRLNSETGAIENFLSFDGDPDPGVIAGGALWIPNETGHRILRFDLADLAR